MFGSVNSVPELCALCGKRFSAAESTYSAALKLDGLGSVSSAVERPGHLIVDGSNILQARPDLKAMSKRDRPAARSQLVQQLAVIHDAENIRVTVVFDGRGSELVIEHPLRVATFAVIYSASSQTADDVIEHLVAHSADATACQVATDDNAERQTVSALGAHVLRSSDLASWQERVACRQQAGLERRAKDNARAWNAP